MNAYIVTVDIILRPEQGAKGRMSKASRVCISHKQSHDYSTRALDKISIM